MALSFYMNVLIAQVHRLHSYHGNHNSHSAPLSGKASNDLGIKSLPAH